MKKILFLFAILIVCLVKISAQIPKEIKDGVLNGKAITLVKPNYPAAARSVNASGSVSVQILIDEQGNVVSANVVSGHPLLRSAAVKAALESKFSATSLSGQPVKVSGIVVYNFVGRITPKTFSEIGFALGILEKAEIPPNNISIYEISDNLPAEWVEEKEKLLDLYKKPKSLPVESEKQVVLKTEPAENKLKTVDVKSDSSPIGDMMLRVAPSTSAITINPAQYSDERPKISAELIKMIEKRLEIAPSQLWKFKAGTVFGKISEQSGDLEKIQTEASNLSKLIETAPNEISAVNLENMGKLMMMIQSDNITEERKAEIKSLANSLKIF